MSRIGKAPIDIPDKVEVTINGQTVTVKGPKGELTHTFEPEVTVVQEDKQLLVKRHNDERRSRAMHGLSRSLLFNMVHGCSQGAEKRLEMVGVGYRAARKAMPWNCWSGIRTRSSWSLRPASS
ncbi:MAG: 50S ribosomal protein L6 [Vampirovibrionales bacterium]